MVFCTRLLCWTVLKQVTLGKLSQDPLGESNSALTCGVGNNTYQSISGQIFRPDGVGMSDIYIKKRSSNYVEEIEKTRASYSRHFPPQIS